MMLIKVVNVLVGAAERAVVAAVVYIVNKGIKHQK